MNEWFNFELFERQISTQFEGRILIPKGFIGKASIFQMQVLVLVDNERQFFWKIQYNLTSSLPKLCLAFDEVSIQTFCLSNI